MPMFLVGACEAGGATVVSMSTITAAMSDVFTLVGTVITQICGQPILLFLLAASLVPIGLNVFQHMKGAARA